MSLSEAEKDRSQFVEHQGDKDAPTTQSDARAVPAEAGKASKKKLEFPTADSINAAVLSFLKEQLGSARLTEGKIAELLHTRGMDSDEAATLAHTIARWPKPRTPDPNLRTIPDSFTLLKLAHLFDVSLDRLMGHVVRNARTTSESKHWLQSFLARCLNLSCYVVFVPRDTATQWVADAQTIPDGDTSAKIELATKWTHELQLFDASAKLRIDHRFRPAGPLNDRTMNDLIQARLGWIKRVPKDGRRLADLARKEFYLGVFEHVKEKLDSGQQSRFPTMKGRDLKSLRIRYDALPSSKDELGWIVYYSWGPPLSTARVHALLRQQHLSDGNET